MDHKHITAILALVVALAMPEGPGKRSIGKLVGKELYTMKTITKKGGDLRYLV